MRKRKRIWPRVLLGALGALILVAAVVALFQRENIEAFIVSRRFTQEELEDKLATSDAAAEKILEKLPEVSVRPPTEEEKERIRRGEVSEEDAVKMILTPSGPSSGSKPAVGGDVESSAVPVTPEDERERRAAELIAEVYVLRESMTGRIEDIIGAAKSDFDALPSDERTSAKKREIAARYIGEISSLEKDCDARMLDIIGELKTILSETDGDTAVADEIMQAYKDEKNLKKSYFLSQYS
jgi:hypothetical protein